MTDDPIRKELDAMVAHRKSKHDQFGLHGDAWMERHCQCLEAVALDLLRQVRERDAYITAACAARNALYPATPCTKQRRPQMGNLYLVERFSLGMWEEVLFQVPMPLREAERLRDDLLRSETYHRPLRIVLHDAAQAAKEAEHE